MAISRMTRSTIFAPLKRSIGDKGASKSVKETASVFKRAKVLDRIILPIDLRSCPLAWSVE